MIKISLKAGFSLIFWTIFWNIWGQKYLDPNQILPYQIFNFFNLYSLLSVPYPKIMLVGNIFFPIVAIILLSYGRIDQFILTRNHEQEIILLKILIVIIMIGLSASFISDSITIMSSPPSLLSSHSRNIQLNSQNITGTFQINLRTNYVVQGFSIPTDVIVKLHESENKSSIVNIHFSDAEVSKSINDTSIENKTITLTKTYSNGTINTYYAGPILSYQNGGKFDALLTIENNSSQKIGTKLISTLHPISFPLNSLISIYSFETFDIQKQNNVSNGLSLLVIGLTIILISSIITKLVDYCDRYVSIQKKRFYE